jgi:hypothetical protein
VLESLIFHADALVELDGLFFGEVGVRVFAVEHVIGFQAFVSEEVLLLRLMRRLFSKYSKKWVVGWSE